MGLADASSPPPDHVFLGTLGRSFKLAGGMRFRPAGEAEATALPGLERVFVIGLGETRLRDVMRHRDEIIVFLGRVRDREQAKRLANAAVYAPEASLPATDPDAFYVDDLIGTSVVVGHADRADEPVGEVVDVISSGGQELLVVDAAGGEVLLPWQAPYVRFDGDTVRLVDPPHGLLE